MLTRSSEGASSLSSVCHREHERRHADRRALRASPAPSDPFTDRLIGSADAFRAALDMIRRVARYSATVLLAGETGTGKELAARAIHYLGAARDGPFVPVNCGALPDGLAENELFGHARGAYTGAQQAQSGVFEAAANGTLFLDEIECLSLKSQASLLRVLQDQTYRPLGSARLVQGRARVIVASNCNLEEMVRDGTFRQDLYFRLSVLSVDLPPLRERRSDIPLLARHFLRIFSRQYGLPEKRLCEKGERVLLEHHWPGNVRELENFVHRAFLMCEGTELCVREGDLLFQDANAWPGTDRRSTRCNQISIPRGKSFSTAKAEVVAEFERRYLEQLMQDSGGNVSLAARLSGKERRNLGRLLKKHGLARDG